MSQLKCEIIKYEEVKKEVDEFFYDYFDLKNLEMKSFFNSKNS